jgi:hypothetical protein
MKQFGALVLVAIASLILMGQASKNRVLDADSLVIRDANGKEVIVLGTGSENMPFLRMMGGTENKSMNVLMASDVNGGALTFLGKGGTLVSLGSNLSDNEEPLLMLQDKQGGTEVGIASVHTHDSDKFSAYSGKTNTVNPKTGSTTQTSAASLILFGKDGKSIYQVP